MESMRSRPVTLLLACAAVAATACASLPVGASASRTADELAGDAIRNLTTTPDVRFQGSLIDAQGRALAVSMTTTRQGDGRGSLTVNGRSVEVLASGGHTYYRGEDFWTTSDPKMAKLYGGSWVAAVPSGLGDVLIALTRRATISEMLGSRRYGLRRGGTSTVNGQSVVALSDASGSILVTTRDPTRLVRLAGTPGFLRPDGSHDLQLDFDYPPDVTVTPPARFIDPNDPSTLPAHLVAVSTTTGRCDASACEQVVTVRNTAGPPAAEAAVTVRLTGSTGAVLGTCTAPVPPTGYNDTATVRCSVSGAAWAAYARMPGFSSKSVHARATLHNPPYDS